MSAIDKEVNLIFDTLIVSLCSLNVNVSRINNVIKLIKEIKKDFDYGSGNMLIETPGNKIVLQETVGFDGEYQIGYFLFEFLYLDLSWVGTSDDLVDNFNKTVGAMKENKRPIGRLLLSLFPASNDPEILESNQKGLLRIAGLQSFFRDVVFSTLDIEGLNHDLSPAERYEKLSIQKKAVLQYLSDEPGHDVKLRYKIEEGKVQAVFDCSSLIPLCFFDFWELIKSGKKVKRCENCGRYFLMYSSASKYCDHIDDETGKTCKEYAPIEKYKENIRSGGDVAIVYKREEDNHRKRSSRQRSAYPVIAFEKWRDTAKALLKCADAGFLSAEEYKQLIKPPHIDQEKANYYLSKLKTEGGDSK